MRILLAEDDPYSLRIMRLILESEQSYEIVAVSDGDAAWRELDGGVGFGLCIFDIMMPGLDGLQLTAKLREDPRFRQQPIILCTALNDRVIVDQAAALRVTHYIVKPYTKELVLRQVRKVSEESPAMWAFEPQSETLARLGVSARLLRELFQELYADLGLCCVELASGPPLNVLRLNSLKSAAVNLGARSLAMRLSQLERSLIARKFEDLPAQIVAVETERERLRLHAGLQEAVAPEAADKSADATGPAPAAPASSDVPAATAPGATGD